MQGERQPRQQLQVNPVRRADDGKQHVDRVAVQRPEVDRLGEEGEGDHRPHHVQDDRVAHVGDGDAVADAGRSQGFPRDEEPQQQLAVHAVGQRQDLHQGPKCLVLGGVREVVMNAAGFQRLRQGGDDLGFRFQVVEQLQGNLDVVRRRPLQ